MIQFLSDYNRDEFYYSGDDIDVMERETDGLLRSDEMGEDYRGSDQGMTSMVDDDDLEDDDDVDDDDDLDVDEIDEVDVDDADTADVVPTEEDLDDDLDVDEDDDDDDEDDV